METGKALAVLWVTRGEGLCPATADGNGEENLHRGESNLSTQSFFRSGCQRGKSNIILKYYLE